MFYSNYKPPVSFLATLVTFAEKTENVTRLLQRKTRVGIIENRKICLESNDQGNEIACTWTGRGGQTQSSWSRGNYGVALLYHTHDAISSVAQNSAHIVTSRNQDVPPLPMNCEPRALSALQILDEAVKPISVSLPDGFDVHKRGIGENPVWQLRDVKLARYFEYVVDFSVEHVVAADMEGTDLAHNLTAHLQSAELNGESADVGV